MEQAGTLTTRRAPQHTKEAINVGAKERLASLMGGGALIMYGLARRNWGSVPLVLMGGSLVYRGTTGHCNVYQALGVNHADSPAAVSQGIKVERSITLNKSPGEVYQFWRKLENLPRFMRHLEAVKETDAKHSRWVAKGPGAARIAWEAEIIAEKENELLSWKSLPGADVPNAGAVRFTSAENGRQTSLKVTLSYDPPAGTAGKLLAQALGADPEKLIAEDLRRFKQLLETGEIATIEGQPSGREEKAA